ncbi:hypothetical protein [Streptosporangium vulgare]|uniref:Uncharacterized protein n=1 Tax=Streptosporangium vulgare TaxID=46190 RepID=A0ABV5TQ46_9ACTN
MTDPRLPDVLLTRGHRSEHTTAAMNLRRALTEVQRLTDVLAAALDTDPATAMLSGDGRALVHYAGEAASFAAELEMANRLAFLLPTTTEED